MGKISLSVLLLMTLGLSSCLKDQVSERYSFFRPVYQTRAEVKASIRNDVPEQVQVPGKIVLYKSWLFVIDVDKGIHLIDISNPAQPVNKYFIKVPGCTDIAIKNDYLYADCYTDLITMDISDPAAVQVKQYLNGVFPYRAYAGFQSDTTLVIREWVRVDTVIRRKSTETFQPRSGIPVSLLAGSFSSFSGTSSVGITGSTARFGILNTRMYTVSYDALKVFNITQLDAPKLVREQRMLQGDIETIFPYKDKLFIGAQSGMHIFDVANPDQPVKLSQFTHARACDPVVADDKYAYVTLRSAGFCRGIANQLDVVNIQNITSPTLVKSYQLKAPQGLSIDGQLLFICDGTDGLKVFNAGNPNAVTQIRVLDGFEPHDVIAYQGYAIAVAKEGIYIVDYRNTADIKIISSIALKK
jgi:hypothetical protein